MKRRLFVLASIILFGLPVLADQPKALFYLTREPKSVRSFLAHADRVDILVPTWYSVDANGLVSGGPNSLVLETHYHDICDPPRCAQTMEAKIALHATWTPVQR